MRSFARAQAHRDRRSSSFRMTWGRSWPRQGRTVQFPRRCVGIPSGTRSSGEPYLYPDSYGGWIDGSSNLGFADHKFDTSEWGTVDMSARQYSPRLGRFLTPDAALGNIFNRRNHNPFAYVWNNPTTYNDPSGNDGPDAEIVGGPGGGGQDPSGSPGEILRPPEPPETSSPQPPVQGPTEGPRDRRVRRTGAARRQHRHGS